MNEIDFRELDAQVAKLWLLKREYRFYALLGVFLLSGFGFSFLLAWFYDSLWIQILNMFLLWFMRLQSGMFAHELSHFQVLKSRKKSSFFASVVWAIFCWLPASWWENKHNAHHKNTNQLHSDPDLEIPLVFDATQLPEISYFLKKYILPFQHFIFFPWLFFTYFLEFRKSMMYVFQNLWDKKVVFEFTLIVLSISTFWLFVFTSLSFFNACVYFFWHLFISWFYMWVTFAPNHYGETVIDSNADYKREYQITTSRNISGWDFATFFLGWLNYQIEHHLYPTMPRNHLKKANKLVKIFCKQNGIKYHQANIILAFVEMTLALRKMAKTQFTQEKNVIEIPNIEVFKKEI